MKKTLSVITVLSLILLCMLSCGEEHALKGKIQHVVDSLQTVTGTKLTIKYDKFYGCAWKFDDNTDKKIIKKYGKKKYDEIVTNSLTLIAISTISHKAGDIQKLKQNAIEIDKILKECGITPASYFTLCRLEMSDPISEQKASCVMAFVGNSNVMGGMIDESSFEQMK